MFSKKQTFISIFILTSAFLVKSSSSIETCNAPSKLLETLNGKIKGECYQTPVYYTGTNVTKTDVLSWMAVPYAQPPINENRFQNPIPVTSWAQTRDGTIPPKSCLQVGLAPGETSEDCLYLNIYVQSKSYASRANTLKPILVFIHGGSYVTGASTLYSPFTLVAMSDIVVVTINYRLNALGFLHVRGTKVSGNQALLDTTLALKWISENAKMFGGDASKITISGESAGAWSVGFMLYYPKSWPYFRNGILQSGGPTGINNGYKLLTSTEATSRADIFFWFLGCVSWTYQGSVDCAKKKTEAQILEAYNKVDEYMIYWKGKYETELYWPVIDSVVYNKTIQELSADKAFKKCSIMTGFNANEASLFVLYVYKVLGDDFENAVNVAKKFNFEEFYKGLKKFLKYFPIYPYQDNGLINRIYNEYFTQADIQTINPSNIGKILLGKLSKIASDFQYNCQSTQLASIYSRNGLNAYVYKFMYDLVIKSIQTDMVEYFPGPTHGDELSLTFAKLMTSDYASYTNDAERVFTRTIVGYWTNFVKFNNPSYELSSGDTRYWKPFVEGNFALTEDFTNVGRIINFRNNGTSMVTGFKENHCAFWKFI